MWAKGVGGSIERTLCINCKECVKKCTAHALNVVWGKVKKS
jgi:formate hydrogenlyase subunit 6/NADH:ubiquinone oxidoreductase subunit I